ncbi:MAG TPA: hypothetical protein VF244_10715 [Acidimicrobiales bacterium]
MTEDADRSLSVKMLVGKAKELVGKATEAVSGLVKKDDGEKGGTIPTPPDVEPTENAQQMKANVEAARQARTED